MLIVKKTVALLMIIALLGVAGCARYHYEGAAAGGAVGGIAGALLDDNPWRGGVIGAALGAVLGATLTEISAKGRREAIYTGEPVEYRTRASDGTTGVYRADPLEYNPRTECHKVRERVWEDGRLVRDDIREVCESEKIERRY